MFTPTMQGQSLPDNKVKNQDEIITAHWVPETRRNEVASMRKMQKNEKKSRIEINETNARSKNPAGNGTRPSSPHQAHSHSANTHHLALRSARTRPRHVPFSPILMTVSHAVVKPASVSSTALVPYSCLRVRRMIF